MSAAPGVAESQGTLMREGLSTGVGPLRVDANAGGVHVETGREEAAKTKWEEEREAKRAKKERVTVTQEELDAEAEATKRKEQRTNKYEDGVDQVVSYFAEFFGNEDGKIIDTAGIQEALAVAGIDLVPLGGDETPEIYARRAAKVVFHETRVEKYGKASLAKTGDVSETKGAGKLLWRGFRLSRQVQATRTTLSNWRDGMGDRLHTYNSAGIRTEYLVNQQRGTLDIDAAAVAAGVNMAGEGMQDLLERTRRGELVNPLEVMLGRLIKFPEDKIPSTDIREADRVKNIGEQVGGIVKSAIDKIGLPTDVLPLIVRGDTAISELVEGLLGVASQSPEAIYKAHEALLNLQAASTALMEISGGKMNLMLQLNKIIAEKTGGIASVSDMLTYTRPIADDYLVRHPEQGIEKLFNDARRERVALGGDTVVERRRNKAAYSAARNVPFVRKAVRQYETPKGTRDVYAEGPEEEAAEEEAPEYIPKWWHLGKKAWEARMEHRAAKAKAKVMPESFETGEKAAREKMQRDAELASLDPAELARLARERVAQPAQPVAPEPEEEVVSPEQVENELQRREDAEIKAAQDAVNALTQRVIYEMRNPRRVESMVNALADELEAAGRSLADTQIRVDTRRNPTFYANRAVLANPDSDEAQKSAAYQALTRDYPDRMDQINTMMAAAPTPQAPQTPPTP